MPAPRELSQQISTPGQKLEWTSPRVGTNVWCKSPGVLREGMIMDKIDTCIASYLDLLFTRDKNNNTTTKLYDKRDAFGFHM